MEASLILPPALALILAGFALPLMRGQGRVALILLAPILSLWMVWQVPDGIGLSAEYLGQDLVLVTGSKLGRLFATVFSITAFLGGLFALRQPSQMELSAAFIYAGSAIGVTFAGDLLTLFAFWEVMAIASTFVLFSNGARAAAMRYALMHLLGGVLLMVGIAGVAASGQSLAFGRMQANDWPHYLILAGFLINTAAVPLSSWLPDAYPEASWSGMVFLSAFTTKTAVFVLIVGFAGTTALIWIGLAMVFYGIVWAILENDMRRVLAYSIVNQVGFMVTAVGIGSEMALNGAAAHAFAHIIYKALLLMSAGSVMYMTGRTRCTDLGGLFRTMPVTMICGVIGALAISAFPFTSGFVAKSMVTQSAADQHLALVWYLLMAASAGVFLYTGIKFPWFVFFQKDSGLRPTDPPKSMQAAMIIASVLCIVIGVMPAQFYKLLPYSTDYVPYTVAHVVTQSELLLFSGLAFFVMLGWLQGTRTVTLDADWIWRKPGKALAQMALAAGNAIWRAVSGGTINAVVRVCASAFHHHGPGGRLGRTWPTGTMAFWTTVMLAGFLIVGGMMNI